MTGPRIRWRMGRPQSGDGPGFGDVSRGENISVSRRNWLKLLPVVVLSPCLLALGPDAPIRQSRFFVHPKHISMVMDLRELLRRTDREAMAMLDSGFPTRFVVHWAVFRGGQRSPFLVGKREIKIHRDPWLERYVVITSDDGAKGVQREYTDRNTAIAACIKSRIRIGARSDFGVGPGSPYFVRVSALRNPTDDLNRGRSSGGRDTQSVGDSAVFSRWVGFFATARPRAEVVLELRSNAFYVPEEL